jgi:hypothetical protein
MRIFDKAELSLFESLFHEKLEPIQKRRDSERYKIDRTPSPANRLYLSIAEHKRFKREFIDARVQAYMETCQRVLKSPNNLDYQEFQIELAGLAQGATEDISRIYNDPLGPIQAQSLERILELLNMELGQMVTWALTPLRRFISEGEVSAQQAIQPSGGSCVSGFGNYWYEAFQEHIGRRCSVLSDLDWNTTKNYLDRIPSDLEKVDFLRRIEQLPDDGIVNSTIANPTVHNRNTRALIHPMRDECARLLSRYFDLESVLHHGRHIGDHQEALSYLWNVLQDYKKYHPRTRQNQFIGGQLAFCNSVDEEIQYRRDLQLSSLTNRQTNFTSIGEIRMGDSYLAGQAGAIGPNAHAHDMTQGQTWNRLEGSISRSIGGRIVKTKAGNEKGGCRNRARYCRRGNWKSRTSRKGW